MLTPSANASTVSRYRTCAVGGCERNFERCEIHHLLEWDHGGETDLANLVPICSFHHHRAHEGRWHLQLEASSRELMVWLPDGSLHSRCLPDMLTDRADRLAEHHTEPRTATARTAPPQTAA